MNSVLDSKAAPVNPPATDLTELAALLAQHCPQDGVHATPLPHVSLIRSSRTSIPIHTLQKPALCIVAQGQKRVFLGTDVYTYGPRQQLVASVDLPMRGEVISATPTEPYFCLMLELDTALLSELRLEANLESAKAARQHSYVGLTLSPTDPEVLDAATRMLRLLRTPQLISALAPLVEREILYRLLLGDETRYLNQLVFADSKLRRIAQAIVWLKAHYREPFRIEVVAAEARMSSSALHHHFKVVTKMSPLQYQKHLRLQEARRLLLSAPSDAATVGFSVGYESPSQFSREYARMFGAPPQRDVARLKARPLQHEV